MTNEARDIKVKTLIARECGLMLKDMMPENRLDEDLGLDSLDKVMLVMAVEDEFEIEISDDAEEKIKTVGDVLAYIARVTPNVEVTGAARLYRAASSDRRERGRPPG
jgi:acyl carrier protein